MPIGTDLLDAIDEAIASAPWYLPSSPVLFLTGRREIAGIYGTRVRGDDVQPLDGEDWGQVEPVTHPGVTFVWTRRDCKRMQKAIRTEAQHILAGL